jgi:hypothetical protein
MPEARLARTRRSLPEGYQFGDAAAGSYSLADYNCAYAAASRLRPIAVHSLPWRRPSDNAAERLARRGWNVIEGEDH